MLQKVIRNFKQCASILASAVSENDFPKGQQSLFPFIITRPQRRKAGDDNTAYKQTVTNNRPIYLQALFNESNFIKTCCLVQLNYFPLRNKKTVPHPKKVLFYFFWIFTNRKFSGSQTWPVCELMGPNLHKSSLRNAGPYRRLKVCVGVKFFHAPHTCAWQIIPSSVLWMLMRINLAGKGKDNYQPSPSESSKWIQTQCIDQPLIYPQKWAPKST